MRTARDVIQAATTVEEGCSMKIKHVPDAAVEQIVAAACGLLGDAATALLPSTALLNEARKRASGAHRNIPSWNGKVEKCCRFSHPIDCSLDVWFEHWCKQLNIAYANATKKLKEDDTKANAMFEEKNAEAEQKAQQSRAKQTFEPKKFKPEDWEPRMKKELQRQITKLETEDDLTRYTVRLATETRPRFESTHADEDVGMTQVGEIVVEIESRVQTNGIRCVRYEGGWVDMETADGQMILEPDPSVDNTAWRYPDGWSRWNKDERKEWRRVHGESAVPDTSPTLSFETLDDARDAIRLLTSQSCIEVAGISQEHETSFTLRTERTLVPSRVARSWIYTAPQPVLESWTLISTGSWSMGIRSNGAVWFSGSQPLRTLCSVPNKFSLGHWHHIAAVQQHDEGRIETAALFLDAEEVDSIDARVTKSVGCLHGETIETRWLTVKDAIALCLKTPNCVGFCFKALDCTESNPSGREPEESERIECVFKTTTCGIERSSQRNDHVMTPVEASSKASLRCKVCAARGGVYRCADGCDWCVCESCWSAPATADGSWCTYSHDWWAACPKGIDEDHSPKHALQVGRDCPCKVASVRFVFGAVQNAGVATFPAPVLQISEDCAVKTEKTLLLGPEATEATPISSEQKEYELSCKAQDATDIDNSVVIQWKRPGVTRDWTLAPHAYRKLRKDRADLDLPSLQQQVIPDGETFTRRIQDCSGLVLSDATDSDERIFVESIDENKILTAHNLKSVDLEKHDLAAIVVHDRVLAKVEGGDQWCGATVLSTGEKGVQLFYDKGDESKRPVSLNEIRFLPNVERNYNSTTFPSGAQPVTVAQDATVEHMQRKQRARLRDERKDELAELVGLRVLRIGDEDITGYMGNVTEKMEAALAAEPSDLIEFEFKQSYRVFMQIADDGCREAHMAKVGVQPCDGMGVDKWQDSSGAEAGTGKPFICPDVKLDRNETSWVATVRGLLPGVRYQFWVQQFQGDRTSSLTGFPPTCECTTAKIANAPPPVLPLAGGKLPVNSVWYNRPDSDAPSGADAVLLCNELFNTSTSASFAGIYDIFVGKTRVNLIRTDRQRKEDSRLAKVVPQVTPAYYSAAGPDWNLDYDAWLAELDEIDRLKKLREKAQTLRLKHFLWKCEACDITQEIQARICRRCGRLNPAPKEDPTRYDQNVEWNTVYVAHIRWEGAAGFGMEWDRHNVVTAVFPECPADREGVKEGDRIISVGGTQVDDECSVDYLLANESRCDAIKGNDTEDGDIVKFVLQNERTKDTPSHSGPADASAAAVAALAARSCLIRAPICGDEESFLHAILATLVLNAQSVDSDTVTKLPPFAYNQQHATLTGQGCSASFGALLEFFTSVAETCTELAEPVHALAANDGTMIVDPTPSVDKGDEPSAAADAVSIGYLTARPSFWFSLESIHVGATSASANKLSLSEADMKAFAEVPLGSMAEMFAEEGQAENVLDGNAFNQNMGRLRKHATGNTAARKSLERLQTDLDRSTAASKSVHLKGMQSLVKAMTSTSLSSIRSELQRTHAQCMKLVAVLSAQFDTEYESTQQAISGVMEFISHVSQSIDEESQELQAAKLELMMSAGRAWSPSMMDLVGLMMSADRNGIISQANPFIKDPDALFVGVTGVIFRCVRLRQIRSCVAASQRLADDLFKVLTEAVLSEVRRQPPIDPYSSVMQALHAYRLRQSVDIDLSEFSGKQVEQHNEFCVGPIYSNHEAAAKATAWVEANKPDENWNFTGEWNSRGGTSYCQYVRRHQSSVAHYCYDTTTAIAQIEATVRVEAAWLQMTKTKCPDDADATGRVIIAATTLAECNVAVNGAELEFVNGEYEVDQNRTQDGVISYEHLASSSSPLTLRRCAHESGTKSWIIASSDGYDETIHYRTESSASLPPRRGWMQIPDDGTVVASTLTIELASSCKDSSQEDWLVGDSIGRQLELARRGCHAGPDCLLPDLRQFKAADADSLVFSGGAKASVLQSTADALTALLCSKREYATIEPSATVWTAESTVSIDPRFLAFEFVSPFMLRKMQVDILQSFMQDAATAMDKTELNGLAPRQYFTQRSAVKQMIMGAGKTTVIGPLLCVVLADGKKLVAQIVPDALLAMSCEVMFSVLSTIFSMRVYTLEYERNSRGSKDSLTKDIYKKASAAKLRGGVMITTPNR